MESLGFRLREEVSLNALTQDVLKSSEIEGEKLDPDQVRSSLARRMGIDIGALTPADRHVDGVVEMMLNATQQHEDALTKERLFGWHAALFPTGRSGMSKIRIAAWRDDSRGPMQVVSGPVGREQVHFTAPPAERVDDEMSAFLDWFERETSIDGVLKAGIAHLWFVTIHPFEDGNGRIARAIADMTLARSENSRQRFYSMSSQIRQERNTYYDTLERTQTGSLDITDWLAWFFRCLQRAIKGAEEISASVTFKAKFWKRHADVHFNERQRKVLNMMLDGFNGKLTSSKWAKVTKSSQDTAARDIDALVRAGVLKKGPAGGRSTSYELVEQR
jgi:Fic family protein